MREKIISILPFLFLLLFIGFVGGMERSANMTVPLIGAIVCLLGFTKTSKYGNDYEEDEDE